VLLQRLHERIVIVGDAGGRGHVVAQRERDQVLVLDLDRADLVRLDIADEIAVGHFLGRDRAAFAEEHEGERRDQEHEEPERDTVLATEVEPRPLAARIALLLGLVVAAARPVLPLVIVGALRLLILGRLLVPGLLVRLLRPLLFFVISIHNPILPYP
jgi:hypothetical protein